MLKYSSFSACIRHAYPVSINSADMNMARDDEDTTTTPDTRGKYWSEIEQLQFKNGVIAKGWSSWASMAGSIIPTRDASQIGSYAQKLLRNYPEEVDWLIQEHHKKMTMEVMAAAAVAVAKGGGSKPKRAKKPSSSPPPRRRRNIYSMYC